MRESRPRGGTLSSLVPAAVGETLEHNLNRRSLAVGLDGLSGALDLGRQLRELLAETAHALRARRQILG